MVMIAFELPEALAEQARAAGLLTDEAIMEILEEKLEKRRQEAAERLWQIAKELQEAAREDFAGMTEDEVMDMINEEVRAVREERFERQKQSRS
jgi:glutamyl-tRNA reductase